MLPFEIYQGREYSGNREWVEAEAFSEDIVCVTY